MTGFYCKNRVKLLAQKYHLKIIVDCGFPQCLLKARMLFEIQQMENRIVDQAVLKVVSIKNLFHHIFNDLGIIHFLAVNHNDQWKSDFISRCDQCRLQLLRYHMAFPLKDHKCRNSCSCQLPHWFALTADIFTHPCKGSKHHCIRMSTASYSFFRTLCIHNGNRFYPVVHASLSCYNDTFSKRF